MRALNRKTARLILHDLPLATPLTFCRHRQRSRDIRRLAAGLPLRRVLWVGRLDKAFAHLGWRLEARKNGLKAKQLYASAEVGF
jgi:hypothetical protein